jgi:hypothetical protein
MLHAYQVFITSLTTRDKSPLFDDLIGILMQEEEWIKSVENRLKILNH